MARSAGLTPRRGYMLDRSTVLLGGVLAGTRGAAAATRTGAAQLLNTRLDAQNVYKAVLYGQTSNVAGGYLIQAAHVDEGAAAPTTDYVTIGVIEGSGIGIVETALSGANVNKLVKAASNGAIQTLGTVTGGSGYTAADTYTGVALTGGTGTGAVATIVVAGGAVTTVTLTSFGKGYTANDSLTTANSNLGGAGSGFAVPVATIKSVVEPRVAMVRLVAGTGSNGAAEPAGTMTIALQPAE
jgi:hypothetical protein